MLYENIRKTVACNRILKRELTEAFKTSHKALASKLKPSALSNAVTSIAVCRTLNTTVVKKALEFFCAVLNP